MARVEDVDKVLSKVDELKVVSILRNLVKIPSPLGHEDAKADYVAREMERLGLEVVEMLLEPPSRRNVIGILRGEGTGRSVMCCAHLDTPWPMETQTITYEAEVRDRKIYGIGTGDSMSPIAAFFGALHAIKRAGVSLKGDVIFLTTADELGHKVGAQMVEENGIKADMCLIGEPTGLDIGIAHTGKVEMEVRTKGRSELLLSPYAEQAGLKVTNAVLSMNTVINYLRRMVKEDTFFHHKHPLIPGEGAAFYFGPIIGGSTGYGEPTRKPGLKEHGVASPPPTWCKLRVGARYWPGQTSKEFAETVNRWVGKAKTDDPSIEAETEVYLNHLNDPIETPAGSEVVNVLKRAVRHVLGRDPKLIGNVYSTEGPFYKRAGMQVAWCGPTMLRFGTPNEHITVDELLNASRVYATAFLDICAGIRT